MQKKRGGEVVGNAGRETSTDAVQSGGNFRIAGGPDCLPPPVPRTESCL